MTYLKQNDMYRNIQLDNEKYDFIKNLLAS